MLSGACTNTKTQVVQTSSPSGYNFSLSTSLYADIKIMCIFDHDKALVVIEYPVYAFVRVHMTSSW